MVRKKVVIVGGGFGGLNAAKGLCGHGELDVTVIDRRNHHLFQPLLYQVAMAGLSPAEIAMPIRAILHRCSNIDVLLGNVTDIDLQAKFLKTDFRDLSFDYLILACGASHSYFGHDEWEDDAPGLKTLEQATDIRRRVLCAFEMAERETDAEKIKSLLTFVIVGGGPTGVELAGALGEITRFTLAKDFRNINPERTRIILIEAGERILPTFTPESGHRASRDLESLGVMIWTRSRVTEISDKGVKVGNEWIEAQTVIWAAGVKPSELNATLPAERDRQGRVIVGQDLSLPSYPNVFVIGDQACFIPKEGQKPLPGLAPVAIQQGRFVAKLIVNETNGRPRGEFRYLDKGQLATIGRKRAVLEIGSFRMSGLFAWIAWLFVHIYYLIGFKNRFFVLWQWTYSYFTFRRGARLITQGSGARTVSRSKNL